MINISNNLSQFKKGVFDTFKLFKTMYKDDHNIIFLKENKLYVNNIEQLVNNRDKVSDAYTYGIEFALQNLKNFRENICINPILYILSLEIVLNSITDLKDLEKYNFKKVSDALKWYYDNSNLPRAVITKDCIRKLFIKESKDKFLNEIIEQIYIPSNIEIIESKNNYIIKHQYYKLKSSFISGQIIGDNYKLFMTNNLTKELLAKLISLKIPILLIYCNADFYPGDNYNVTTIQLSATNYLKHYDDICMLTGFGRGYQNLDVNELNNHSFGDIKDFKFINGELWFSSFNYLLANDKRLENIKNKYSYYALQGKNLIIETTEEYLEKVRCLVSIIKALQNNGIFYIEPKTLRILKSFYAKTDNNLTSFFDMLLKNYLQLFKFNIDTIQEVVNNQDLKVSFNVFTGKYDEELFTSLDYYLNVFNLLNSNISVLNKLA